MTKEEIEEFLDEAIGRDAADVFLLDGFERAFIGASVDPPRAIYSIETCIKILTRRGMSREDAEDYFWEDVAGACLEESSPLFIYALT
tara:strand:+ start:492 stop:755 length:264 start_codon:yes stop_codon:yes gene_type:complete